MFVIENYHLDVAIHEEAMSSAGFREVRCLCPRSSPDGEAAHGKDFWTSFVDYPPITLIECVK